ncbi:hypothetical protein Gotri_026128 [Gossypium trilobum]|uniref:Uncharacterized protein n=1 Tax=Gossypium trilobum TaxID=34281 RepID=A0A7J9FM68_9ROSI|nr:hypothetical protein [Gossypium trilobum]
MRVMATTTVYSLLTLSPLITMLKPPVNKRKARNKKILLNLQLRIYLFWHLIHFCAPFHFSMLFIGCHCMLMLTLMH